MAVRLVVARRHVHDLIRAVERDDEHDLAVEVDLETGAASWPRAHRRTVDRRQHLRTGHAVALQTFVLLERHHRRRSGRAVTTVDTAGSVAQRGQPLLHVLRRPDLRRPRATSGGGGGAVVVVVGGSVVVDDVDGGSVTVGSGASVLSLDVADTGSQHEQSRQQQRLPVAIDALQSMDPRG